MHALAADLPTISRLLGRLGLSDVRCCYEAGPCGFTLQQHLRAQGLACEVIAPALIPRRPGSRIKTDRRDAAHLAILYRAGALTPVHVPTEQEEAVRDLLRCREDLCADLLRAKHRLSKFLLRHGRRFTTCRPWSKRHGAWLVAQQWPLPALEQTFQAYRRGFDEIVARLREVDADMRAAPLPRPATRICGASSWKPPGTIGTGSPSARPWGVASGAPRPRRFAVRGQPSSACTRTIGGCSPAGNRR